MLRFLIVLLGFTYAATGHADATRSRAEASERPVLIVDRRPQSISLYFSVPASDLESVFGAGAEGLLGSDGTVDIEGLYEGTFVLADEVFSSVQASIEGTPVPFEGISMMVHDPDALPAFETPWDGETSIAVCTSPETVDKMGLEELQAYLGYFAWKVNSLAPLVLVFPKLGSAEREIEIREFWNMQHIGTRVETHEDGGTLVLEPGQGQSLGFITLWLLAFASLSLGSLLLVMHFRQRGKQTGGTGAT
ncbi:hypothetical protein [Silicimonas sp. MF1-12-2]|uniref:hypothetical protein n=1 Tax=Silicimonas sp. MF1-12-2 TaxID=3384793 RepID=UPI0039B5BF3A